MSSDAAPTSKGGQGLSILILGGMVNLARPLLVWLLDSSHGPTSQDPSHSIAHIRIVDKFLVAKEGSTTYIDPPTQAALADPRVEYRQANLTMAAAVSAAFDAPVGSYDFVFDLTGEGTDGVSDPPPRVLLERTTKTALSLAYEASKRNVESFIRVTQPLWRSKVDEGRLDESAQVLKKRSPPKTAKGWFWYEAERQVAGVKDLRCGVLRVASVWGGWQGTGPVVPRIALGDIYRFLKEPLQMLWSADLPVNTLHATDFCRAAWALTLYLSSRTREAADAEAGEDLPFATLKDKGKAWDVDVEALFGEKEAKENGMLPRGVTTRCPVFNAVDDQETNQGKILDVTGKVFKIETSFVNAAINAWAKLNLGSVVDDLNEKHAEAYTTLQSRLSTPPPSTSPLVFFISPDDASKRAVHLDGSKMRRVLGWNSKVPFDVQGVRSMVTEMKMGGAWVDYDDFFQE